MPTSLAGKRVTVMGLGRFGGGLGVTRFLVEQGASVLLTDRLGEPELRAQLAPLGPLVESNRVALRLGAHDERDFRDADLVVANPAVPTPWRDRYLLAAARAGVPITTEIALLVERLPREARVIAVTGSAGKSTTTALTAHVLGESIGTPTTPATPDAPPRVWMGGNIGGSLLGDVTTMRDADLVVLELSSAMLWWLGGAPDLARAAGREPAESGGLSGGGRPFRLRPDAGVVTSFAPNHLDWHATAEHYERSKQVLLATLRPGSLAILGPGAADWPTPPGVERVIIDQATPLPGLRLPGPHNARNARMALAAAEHVAPLRSRASLCAVAATFPGLPHRLCLVHEAATGVRFYDDSKSTVPGATLLALDALAPAPIHLIAGGYDKKLDLAGVARRAPTLAGLYTIGATGERLAAEAREAVSGPGRPPRAHVEACGTLDRAMAAIRDRALPGDVVLLSPACASWDQFENYEQRGRLFTELARRMFADLPVGGGGPDSGVGAATGGAA